MLKIRPYQAEAIERIKDTFSTSNRQFIEMPTGSGKTVTFLSYASTHHTDVLIIVPSKELLKQVYRSALLFYDKRDISRKGSGFDEDIQKIHICIINSIRGRYLESLALYPFDLVIIDEAHHIQAESYQRFMKAKKRCVTYESTYWLGVTATPDRADGKLIQDLLHLQSYKITVENLIKQKYLSDIEGYSVKTNINLDDIDDHNGDFSLSSLYKKLATESRDNMIVEICANDMYDRKTLVFCINIQHSKSVCRLINQKGIACAHIDGTMNDAMRDSILTAFRKGEISVLCNCQLLTEGFDEPSIDGIVLARPTRSSALFNQMIGRGLRIYPGKKNCKIVDVVDNHKCTASFGNIVTEESLPRINKFNSIQDITNHISKSLLEISEFRIERINFFNNEGIESLEALPGMIQTLTEENIYFQHPISFDEANFLIWHNELKKEFKIGMH